jgi:hypothetical protein
MVAVAAFSRIYTLSATICHESPTYWLSAKSASNKYFKPNVRIIFNIAY